MIKSIQIERADRCSRYHQLNFVFECLEEFKEVFVCHQDDIKLGSGDHHLYSKLWSSTSTPYMYRIKCGLESMSSGPSCENPSSRIEEKP